MAAAKNHRCDPTGGSPASVCATCGTDLYADELTELGFNSNVILEMSDKKKKKKEGWGTGQLRAALQPLRQA